MKKLSILTILFAILLVQNSIAQDIPSTTTTTTWLNGSFYFDKDKIKGHKNLNSSNYNVMSGTITQIVYNVKLRDFWNISSIVPYIAETHGGEMYNPN